MYRICIIPVIWVSLIVAPYIHENIFDMFEHITNNLKTPLKIKLVSDSLEVAIIFIFVYIIGIMLYLSTKKNYWNNVISIY